MPEEIVPTEESQKEEIPTPVEEKKEKRWLKPFLFSILGIVLAAGLVFVGIQVGKKQAGPVTQPTPTAVVTPIPTMPTPTPEPTGDWKTHTNAKCGFTIKYPPELSVDENRGCVHFSLWGPTQKTETEFYDGISLLFDSGQLGNKTLKELIEEEAAVFQDVGEVLIPPTQTTIAGVSGYTFKARGLGVFTYFYVSHKSGVYLEIVDSTVDPTGKGFQKTVDLILSTLKFLK
jgi:hypothetical protein